MEQETYGIYKTPHLDKYQNSDDKTSQIMQQTWNFGIALQGKGKKIAYMHGPVGYYEGTHLETITLEFKTDDHLKEFLNEPTHDDEDYVFFLYQKLPDRLRYTTLSRRYIEEKRKGM